MRRVFLALVLEQSCWVGLLTIHDALSQIEESHEAVAQEGQSAVVADVNTHFIAFMYDVRVVLGLFSSSSACCCDLQCEGW